MKLEGALESGLNLVADWLRIQFPKAENMTLTIDDKGHTLNVIVEGQQVGIQFKRTKEDVRKQ